MVETKENDVAHALTYADNIKAVPCSAAYVYWTDKCLLAMKEIIEEANANESKKDSKGILSIPTGALRTILQLTIDPLLFVALYGGLKTSDLKYFAPGRNAKAFAIAIQYDGFEKDITDGITDWVEGCITEFIERHEVSDSHRETLYELLDNNALFTIKLDIFNLFPWSQFHNGTAKPDNQALGFSITANDVARLLEGKSIFPELPPVMRVVGAYSNSNQAELITPIIETFEEGRFSLVCRLSLETLPTVGKPLIYVDVSKRRWIDSINPKYTTNRSASAYLLDSQKHRAFLFRIEKHKNDKNE